MKPHDQSAHGITETTRPANSGARASVLIGTFVYDITAMTVERALTSVGCHVARWIQPDFTSRQSLCYAVSDDQAPILHAEGPGLGKIALDFDTVWLRRSSLPVVDAARVHRDDLAFAHREATIFLGDVQAVMGTRARMINPREGRARADNKLLQLQLARQAGLSIPPTLVGNDPQRVRDFIASQPQGAIYKPHCGRNWEEAGRRHVLYTSEVTVGDLPAAAILQATPGIYQANIPKQREIRSTFFGTAHLSASIRAF